MDIDLELCASTSGQQSSEAWWEARQNRVTASVFGQVMSARNDKSLESLSKRIKGPRAVDGYVPPACMIGILEEPNAKEAYIRYQREVHNRIVTVHGCWSVRSELEQEHRGQS